MNQKSLSKKLKYKKPALTTKKIRISYFMSQITLLDQFNIISDVYAQSSSSSTSWASTNTNDCGQSATPGEN